MGVSSYKQLGSLDKTYDLRGRLERNTRDHFTINGLSDRILAQRHAFRSNQAHAEVEGMKVSPASIKTLSDGLVERALTADRKAMYATVREQTLDLSGEITKLVELGGTIRDSKAKLVEQTAATNEIARNATEAARGTQDVSMNVAHVLSSSGETGRAAQQVLGAAAELATRSLSVKKDVDDFLAAIGAA